MRVDPSKKKDASEHQIKMDAFRVPSTVQSYQDHKGVINFLFQCNVKMTALGNDSGVVCITGHPQFQPVVSPMDAINRKTTRTTTNRCTGI